ncbi:MAG TPA: permease [Dehalococcoidales bacterium]|nr:permease [Dehalococcoidales bacterium]
MTQKRRLPTMLIPTIIMGVLAVILVVLSYQKGVHIQGLKASGNMLLQIIPLLIFAFLIAGMVQFLIPREIISRWVGAESGFRGLLIGTAMGSIAPGGPFVSMPIAAGLLRTGANIGTMVAFLTAWSLLAFSRIPLELGIMGWKFVLIRMACTFFFPPIAGWIANTLFSRVNVV